MLRSKVNWTMYREKPTKYFLNLEKKSVMSKTLYRLQTDTGETIDNGQKILDEIKRYYQNLYTTTGPVQKDFCDNLDISKLDQDLKEELEEPVTVQELGIALKAMKNNKSPGLDGLPADFWKVFWGRIKELYWRVIVNSIREGCLHQTAHQGIISLLEKVGKEILRLKNWRPLTLLNVDNKIFSKAMAIWLQKAQTLLINAEQTGFVKNQHLATNIIKIMEVMHHCDTEEIDGVLISFDFEKAFDTVEWETIFHVMKLFNFGEKYIEMTKIIFQDLMICAYNDGNFSEFMYPSRGCRQGCCYSPIIFTFVIEMLGLAIRQSADLEGIKIGDSHIKSG